LGSGALGDASCQKALQRLIQDLLALEFIQLREIHGVVFGLEAVECPVLYAAESIGGVALG
jgi:hypothetical protein